MAAKSDATGKPDGREAASAPPIDEPPACRAFRDLQSQEPAVRLAAITGLLALARSEDSAVRSRAREILEQEFGPYVVTDGFIGCAAPLSAACKFDDNGPCCHACAWQWTDDGSSTNGGED